MSQLTEQQLKAVQSIDRHALVSAGAGCGKTLVLVERYMEVLRKNPEATVQSLIAVTFTRKAAEEMLSRLKETLKKAADHDKELRPFWLKLLADVDRARIGTIHSLCESVLKAHPAEAGVDPQFEVLDELERAQMLEQCADQALRELIDNADSSSLLLEYPIEKIKEWLLAQLNASPQYKEARRCIEDFRATALSVIRRVQGDLAYSLADSKDIKGAYDFLTANPFDTSSPLEETRKSALEQLSILYRAYAAGDSALMAQTVCNLAAMPPARTQGGAKGKPLRDAFSKVREAAKRFADQCPLELTEQDEQAFNMLTPLLTLIDASISYFDYAKRQSRKLDYNDMIAKTHVLLTAPGSNARRQLSANIIAVLVDEFQDTNRTQAEMLSTLCGPSSRLFLIGDDKQSIYKFQGADVSTFNEWKEKIKVQQHGLTGQSQLHDLSHSFRSHPAIVEFINRLFQFHFQGGSTSQRSYGASPQALSPARTEPLEAQRVDLVIYDAPQAEGQKPDSQQAKVMESKAIAAWILDKVGMQAQIFCKTAGKDRPIEFGDFAILVQANKDFAIIEPALTAAAIPFVTFAGGSFLDRQEILDIENLLRWLSNPLNDHALLAVLRSPFFAVNDGTLHKIFLEEQGSLWNCLQAASKKESFQALSRPVAMLKQLLSDSQSCSLSEVIASAISITSFDITLLSLPNGKQKSRNAWKMVAFAMQHNQLTLTEFVQALEAMRKIGAGKQSDAPLAADNAVKLMTIHKAKGLEFPAVILPLLGRKIHQGSPKLLVHREYGIALDTSRSNDDIKPSYFRAATVLDNAMSAEEKKRLLYVGMTRARDWLALFIDTNARNDASFRLWIKQGLGLDLQEEPTGSSLVENVHYRRTYVDEQVLNTWEASVSKFGKKSMSDEDLEQLSAKADFSIMAPIPKGVVEHRSAIPWTATKRVTATPQSELHATTVGNLFHAAMQHLIVSGQSDDVTIAELLNMDEFAAVDTASKRQLVSECQRLLLTYQSSRLSSLLKAARRLLAEVGYTTIGATGTGSDKRPDLIFQDEQDNWHIVDFKTDKLTEQDIPAKINEHSAQVLDYLQDFELLTHIKAQGWLYFAEIGALSMIDMRGYQVEEDGQLRLPIAQR